MTLDPELARLSVCYLVTVGRRTGLLREVEIWFAADPMHDRVYMLAGDRDNAHWVRNIRHEPSVRVRVGKRWFTGRAADLTGHADEVHARELVGAKYGYWRTGTQLTGWARDSLPIAIDLVAEPEGPS